MNLLKDNEFRKILLRFVCRDRNFLKTCGHLLTPDDFKPTATGEADANEVWQLASWALEYYGEQGEPIGGLLRSHAIDRADELRFGSKQTQRLLTLVKDIQNSATDVIAVEAVQAKVVKFKKSRAKQRAMDKLLDLQERGELTDEKWYEVTTEANKLFDVGYRATDYFSEEAFKQRMAQRSDERRIRRYPYLFLHAYDSDCRSIGRGQLGLAAGYLKSGKSLLLQHIARAFVWQGLNVLYFTLEDPEDLCTSQFDAAITHLPVRKLGMTPIKMRKRFHRMRQLMHGRLKVVDGTEGGMTARRMEEIWEHERNIGFDADAIIIDYDDEIVPPKKQQERRFEFADIYRELRQLAARRKLFVWVGAQTNASSEGHKIITPRHLAEDISKARKVALCLGIGDGDWGENSKYVNVVASKIDRQKWGFNIVTRYEQSMFYDGERTVRRMKEEGRKGGSRV